MVTIVMNLGLFIMEQEVLEGKVVMSLKKTEGRSNKPLVWVF